MPHQALIRPRTDSDLHALATVLAEVHQLDGYPVEGVGDPWGWLVSSHMLGAWVAALDDAPVGHVMLTSPSAADDAVSMWVERHNGSVDDAAVVGRLFVAPAARGHHIGRQLMAAATACADDRGRRPVLDVMDKDTAAIRLYKSLGWQPMGALRHHHSDGRVEPATAYVAPSPRPQRAPTNSPNHET